MADKEMKEHMQAALDAAYKGVQAGQTPFGASIVKDDKLIVAAHNVVWERMDITAHAEINAIRQACNLLDTVDLSDCVIYSTCEPCPMCFSAIHWAKIKRIVYGAAIEDAHSAGFSEMFISNIELKKLGNADIEIVPGYMKEQAVKLFSDWQKREDRKIY